MQSTSSRQGGGKTVAEVSGSTSASLQTINSSLADLNRACDFSYINSPTTESVAKDVEDFKRHIEEVRRAEIDVTNKIKTDIHNDLSNDVASKLRADIKARIRSEIASQTRVEVDRRIGHYIPIPLETQLKDTEERLAHIQVSLANSQARHLNSAISLEHNLDDPLGEVLSQSGKRSKVYPADLRTLYTYEDKMTQQLLKDYGLPTSVNPTANTNRFLDYIGVSKDWREA